MISQSSHGSSCAGKCKCTRRLSLPFLGFWIGSALLLVLLNGLGDKVQTSEATEAEAAPVRVATTTVRLVRPVQPQPPSNQPKTSGGSLGMRFPNTKQLLALQSFLLGSATRSELEGDNGNSSSVPVETVVTKLLGNISIGTPPQKFLVWFSLQYSHLWVVDDSAKLEERVAMRKKQRYSNSSSSSAVVVGDKIKLAGDIGAVVVNDTVLIGAISVQNVPFGAAVNVSFAYTFDGFGHYSHFDGIFGLGFAEKAGPAYWKAPPSDVSIPSPSKAFVGALAQPVVTFWQEPSNFTGDNVGMNGSLTFGAENTVDCSANYSYVGVNVTIPEYELLPTSSIDSINISSDAFTLKLNKSREIVFVDGLYGIYMSFREADAIAKQLGARKVRKGIYQVNCARKSALPEITLNIGDYNAAGGTARVQLNLDKYIFQPKKKLCILAIVGYSDTEDPNKKTPVVLGLDTLQNKCVSLDYGKHLVGFSDGK